MDLAGRSISFWTEVSTAASVERGLVGFAFAIAAALVALILARLLRLDRALVRGALEPFSAAATGGAILVIILGVQEALARSLVNVSAWPVIVLGFTCLSALSIERAWTTAPAEAVQIARPRAGRQARAADPESEKRRAA